LPETIIAAQEVELERLKTTVVALNLKCAAVNDHEGDVQALREQLEESERKRN
jgi:hypothetical protein